MAGEWIRRAQNQAATVVFVHGILSSGEQCWRHKNGTYWPELLKNEPQIKSLGIYVYSYQTCFSSGSYSLSDVVDDLKEHLITLDQVLDRSQIIFVCHSMGGIVVRKFLVERERDLLDRKTEVGLYLVASPSLGSDYANWLQPVARFAGHAQAKALQFSQDNQWLNDLDKSFQNLKESGRLTIRGKELLEDKFVIRKKFLLFRKHVVSPFSGARYFGEQIKIAGSDHFTIAKPANNKAMQHRLLLAFLNKRYINSPKSDVRHTTTANTQGQQQIFISYRHVKPDQDLALAIESELSSNGLTVFVDRNMQIGTDWAKEIDRQLKSAQVFIVLLSAESIRSDMVRQEINLAHQLKQQGRLSILPVRVDFGGALPYDLGGYLNPLQYAQWEQATPMKDVAQSLLNAIIDTKALPHPGQTDDANDSPAQIQELSAVITKQGAPLPEIDPRLETLEMERGSMSSSSPFYISRQSDADMQHQLAQQGVTVIVKGSRQMGKSSLLVRAAAQAKAQGGLVSCIDFQQLQESQLGDLNTVLRYLIHRLARDIHIAANPDDYWNDQLGAKDSATDFIDQAILSVSGQKVFVMLDEVDRVFHYDYRNDFFGLLRFWTNRRATSEPWNRFNLIIAHSTDPLLWIDDINQSPFNVGHAIRLRNFDLGQIQQLAQCYRLSLPAATLETIEHLLGGQPYLSRQALYLLSTDKVTAQQLEQQAARQDGPFGDHLRRLSSIVGQSQALRDALLQILGNNKCQNEHSFQRLSAAGLVTGADRNHAQLRCRLYKDYFRHNL